MVPSRARLDLELGSSIELKNWCGFLHVRFGMNRTLLVLGVVLLILGVAGYYVTSQTNLIGGRTHSTYPLGGIALAVLGALIAVGGVMMGKAGAKTSNQFKCTKCGATFGSQAALDQHSKDKHKI
jgi:hypothetical protein